MTETYDILVVDDDREVRESLALLLEGGGFHCRSLSGAESVEETLATDPPDVILCDVKMPGMSGMDLLRMLDRDQSPPLVLMSAHGDIPMAVEAMQEGAYSFLEKPFDPRRLLRLLFNAAKFYRLSKHADRLRERLSSLSGLDRILIGNTTSIAALRERVLDLGDSTANVLIVGETGTGKELVARALHDLGTSASTPFVPVSCAAVPLDKFEDVMFGIHGGPDGFLAKADGGTLFLDELSSIPLEAQAKLLRAIETKQFSPVGSPDIRHSDFRIVSACNESLEQAIASGAFREDLYFRINTIVLTLPSLRERLDDIALLYTHFVNHFASAYEIAAPPISSEDLSALIAHDWPGNVRELRNVAERRILAARRGGGSVTDAMQKDGDYRDVPDTLREAVAAFERQLIAKALVAHKGRMDSVAEALGIGRRTLNEKIVKLGLNKDDILRGSD